MTTAANKKDAGPYRTDDCWKRIGVSGDRSCPELPAVGHCRNCERFAAAGARALDRDTPEGYAAEWAALLAREKEIEPRGTISVLVFRLGPAWLALSAKRFRDVAHVTSVHTIPHRTSEILRGLANVRGELQLCISLAHFLGVTPSRPPDSETRQRTYRRMVVVDREGARWAFVVDEIKGIYRLRPDQLEETDAEGQIAAYTKGVFSWEGASVRCLADDLLFGALERSVL